MSYVGGLYFNALSTSLLESVLERAREGTLAADWRESLRLPPGVGSAEAVLGDAEQLALSEIREMPHAAWEPGHGSGWRDALCAWYVDSRAVATRRYSDAARQLLDQEDLAVQSLFGVLRTRRVPGGQALWDQVIARDDVDAMRDRTRFSQANMFVQARDRLRASYLAGLAAGGDEVDWQAWFAARVATWPADSHATRKARIELRGQSFRERMQRLPTYWVQRQIL